MMDTGLYVFGEMILSPFEGLYEYLHIVQYGFERARAHTHYALHTRARAVARTHAATQYVRTTTRRRNEARAKVGQSENKGVGGAAARVMR